MLHNSLSISYENLALDHDNNSFLIMSILITSLLDINVSYIIEVTR